MNRAASRRSMMSEPETEGVLEAELAKLQRQYRIMEGDRKAYNEESQNIIRKQKAQIESLRKEKAEIKMELQLARSVDNVKKDCGNSSKLRALIKQEDEFERHIEEENEQITLLDAQLKEWQEKYNDQNKTIGGMDNSRQKHVATQKQIRVLENRLNQATVTFNKHLTTNAELRATIDHLRQERAVFNTLHKKLSKELNDGRQEMCKVTESATHAYDSRDEAQTKMSALKERSDKDKSQHKAELKELLRILDHDQKLKEFMAVKDQERAELKAEEAAKRKRKGNGNRGKDNSHEEMLFSYEQAFSKIKSITGEEDIGKILEKFMKTEDRNFALFNYVNEMNNEIECHQEEIDRVAMEIQKFRSQGVYIEKQRQAILKELEVKLSVATKDADESEKCLKSTKKILDQLKVGVESLFNKINCDKTAITDLLGANDGITDQNMIQYLGIVEQKTNELLFLKQYMQMKEAAIMKPEMATLLAPPPPPPKTRSVSGPYCKLPTASITIQAPSTGVEDDNSDTEEFDDTRPLTLEEIKKRLTDASSRKASKNKCIAKAQSPAGKSRPATKNS
ncbi:coiled-coil domain-containing protein 63-like [Saccoglossus kowalevskii]